MKRSLITSLLAASALALALGIFHPSTQGQTEPGPDDDYAVYNVALAANGATALASSTSGAAEGSGAYTPMAVIDGDRRG